MYLGQYGDCHEPSLQNHKGKELRNVFLKDRTKETCPDEFGQPTDRILSIQRQQVCSNQNAWTSKRIIRASAYQKARFDQIVQDDERGRRFGVTNPATMPLDATETYLTEP